MIINVVIIDDEFLARKKVENLLANIPYVRVIGEARNGAEAVEVIKLKSPDLIFLDIEMPDFGGFDVIKKLPASKIPYVIFATAYDQYALKAFEVRAIDYILKPIDKDRLIDAIELAKDRLEQQKSSEISQKVFQLLGEYERMDKPYRQTFEIKEKGRQIQIGTDEIYLMEANGNYIELQTEERKLLYRSTMGSIIDELDPKEFIRIHRSYFLNTRYISSCKYLSNNEYKFTLKNGLEVVSGRAYKENVIEYLDCQ